MAEAKEAAAVYIRVGNSRPNDMARSESGQHESTSAYLAEQGYELAKLYRDVGGGRSAYNRMLHDAEAGEFDVVVAYHLDRLTRNLGELAQLMDLVDEGNVRIEFVRCTVNLDDTAGRLAARIMANAYEVEDEYASNRQAEADRMRDAHWRRRKGDR